MRVLGQADATVLPVSAKAALKAKLRVGGAEIGAGPSFMGGGKTVAVSPTPEMLRQDAEWMRSAFGEAEQWVFSFLAGGGEGAGDVGGEALRLKLNTPLSVASALTQASLRRLDEELAEAEAEVRTAAFTIEMMTSAKTYGSDTL
eukprot:1110011-Pyramimonas_sp.AAC.1